MLICINKSASAHAAIRGAQRFCINILDTGHEGLVGAFSRSELKAHRFASGNWFTHHGMPALSNAAANIFCAIRESLSYGTHDIIVGNVLRTELRPEAAPLIWFDGNFSRLDI